ncbi:MAG: hypothetical protein Q8M40_13490 [Legionella sp.]|nr:hypothetical protein [Legionella sp.]
MIFLPDKEIGKLKPLILMQLFLVAAKIEKENLSDLLGCQKDNRMLFIAPYAQGLDLGSALCQHAIEHLGAAKVDVNEQNPQARNFTRNGVALFYRSELDKQGKPYPILDLELRA